MVIEEEQRRKAREERQQLEQREHQSKVADRDICSSSTSIPLSTDEINNRKSNSSDGSASYSSLTSEDDIKAANDKAKKAILSSRGKQMAFYMYMHQYLGIDKIQYEALVSCVRSELQDAGLTESELDLVDYDSFIRPFVDEIDNEEDSWILMQNKRRIMATIIDNEAKKKQQIASETSTNKFENKGTEEMSENDESKNNNLILDGTFHTKVVGVTFKNDDGSDRQRIIRNLIRNGELEIDSELFCVPQPDNPYDGNCILVKAGNGQAIGTLSREMAAKVAPQIRQGYVFKAYVASQTGGDIGYAYGINIKVDRYKQIT